MTVDEIKSSYFDHFSKEGSVFLSSVSPTPMPRPELIGWSASLAQLLNIDRSEVTLQILAGNKLPPGFKPYASRYGGHQFGHWAGQLGDGRAITLGQVVNLKGIFEVQIKGSGLTPYSRRGDGRAVLRSSLREFICSEAMFALNIPTTRALSLSLTGEKVIRDILYDGNPQSEKGAIVTRVSPSFVRFGNFEILAADKNVDALRKLADYIIQTHFPASMELEGPTRYAEFFRQVVTKTADLMSDWMAVGFVHGVMNTDNMSILGLTIDYGPYGWVEEFDPDFTPNTTDFSHRRYRFSHQPQVALWNLNALAQALLPLIQDKDLVKKALDIYQSQYETSFLQKFSNKLGIDLAANEMDASFISEMLGLLYITQNDYTRFFRYLCSENFESHFLDFIQKNSYLEKVSQEYVDRWKVWLKEYIDRVSRNTSIERLNAMKQVNPSIIFRNYLAQQAIDRADQGDYTLIETYLKELMQPFNDRSLTDDPITFKRPEWANDRPGCSILSCSS